MKKIFCFIMAAVLAATYIGAYAVEEGAVPGDYEYTNSEERDFVENVLKNRSYNEYNDTSVFEGHKTYLLQESFVEDSNSSYTSASGTQAMPAGWDVDRRGGAIRSDNQSLHIYDASDKYRVYMTHSLMPHSSGDLTLETGLTVNDVYRSGFFFELSGGDKTVLRLETEGEYLCYIEKDGRKNGFAKYTPGVSLPIKAVVHPEKKTVDLIAGESSKLGIPFVEDAGQIDRISLGTGEKEQMYVKVPYVHIYINYIVNERFLTTMPGKTPFGWEGPKQNQSGAGTVSMQSQRSDVLSYKLETSSVLTVPYLTKHYENSSDKIVSEFYMLVPKHVNGIEAKILSGGNEALSIGVKDKNFVLSNGTVLYEDFRSNLWYRFKVITNTETNTADVFVNFRKCAENVPLSSGGKINGIEFTSGNIKGSSAYIDDVNVYLDLPLPTGYPTEPRTVLPDKNVKEVGMLMYSMWREGFHFGWDRLSPYEERTPYAGYYTEGEGETADWAIKWQKEHGITYQIYTWSGVERNEDLPIKRPIRSQAWLEGLGNAQFDMDYCLMWSTPTDKSIRGLDDFKNNILPFWVEYCWKNPRYKRIDNKILLYTYSVHYIRDLLGGVEGMKEAIRLMNEEAKKIGADGVIFTAVEGGNFSNAEAKELGMYRYSYGWGHGSASSSTVVINGITDHMEKGDFRDYIPSVPMGYDDGPWRDDGVGGFMTVKEIQDILSYINGNVEKWKMMGNSIPDMVVLTCWDEWGEGHFWCPSETHGFGYLNAIRSTLTTAGELKDEEMPSKQSYARMGVLYPMGRQMLKLMKDNRETDLPDAEDIKSYTLMQKIDFSNPADFARAEIEKGAENLRNENGLLVFDCLGADPSVFVNNLSLPASKITAVCITGIQPVAGTNTLYYQTTDDPDMGRQGKRFEGSMGSGQMQRAILYPAKAGKLAGTLTRLRIDPPDSAVGTMYVKSIEIYTKEDKTMYLSVNGEDYPLNAPLRVEKGTAFMPIYQYFHGNLLVPCYWFRNEGRLHIEYDGKTIELYDNSADYTINGTKHSFSSPAYYYDGNFYVPVREFFTQLGYSVGYNGDERRVTLKTPDYKEPQSPEADPEGVWSFNTNGSTQGWKPSWHAPVCNVRNGCMELNIISNTAVIEQEGFALKADNYKTLKIRVKNASNANTMRFYYKNDIVSAYGSPNSSIFPMSSNDKDFKEYKIDLTKVTNFGGTIKGLRIDFVGGNSGTVYVDSISLGK